MKYDVNWLKNETNNGEKFNYFGFFGDRSDTHCERTFSNFFRSLFDVTIHDGRTITFECNEQYFMYRKALEFKDFDTL